MKIFLITFLAFTSLAIRAQDCGTSLLFRKGTHLEYKNYVPPGNPAVRERLVEITKLFFVVTEVKDSNNIHYSYVTKTGVNPVDERLTYEKHYIIPCENNKLVIPFDFYSVDTIFFSNMYPVANRDKGIYSSVNYSENFTYQFPLDFATSKFELTNNHLSMDVRIRDYEMADIWQVNSHGEQNSVFAHTGRIVGNNYTVLMNIKNYKTAGKATLTTSFANYECSKIILTTDTELYRQKTNTRMTMFYNTGVGLVKSEAYQSKKNTGYMELVKVEFPAND